MHLNPANINRCRNRTGKTLLFAPMTAIKNFAMQARNILHDMVEKEAGFYGVTKGGCVAPMQKGADFETYKTPAGTENTIYGADIRKRASLKRVVGELGFEQVIEETAYTWFCYPLYGSQ